MSGDHLKTVDELRACLVEIVQRAQTRLAEENQARLKAVDISREAQEEAARAAQRAREADAALATSTSAWQAEREGLLSEIGRLRETERRLLETEQRLVEASVRSSREIAELRDEAAREARRPWARLGRRLEMLRTFRQRRVVARSPLFDRDWYVARYPDVSASRLDPANHYLWFGAAEGRDPGPGFNARAYLDANPDVRREGANPLVHFELFGRAEGRPLTRPSAVAAPPPPAAPSVAPSAPAQPSPAVEADPGPAAISDPQPQTAAPAPDAGRPAASAVEKIPTWPSEFAVALSEIEALLGRPAFVLDWESGLALEGAVPQANVFKVVQANGSTLPHMDQSVDVVVAGSRRLTEARRVASAAVFSVDPEMETLREVWRAPEGPSALPSASIVIPVFNQSATTDECLRAVVETLPFGFRGEILVLDDASTDDTPDLLARWMAKDARIRTIRNEKNLGFLDTCNRAAAAATGEILVLLNNDTLPRPGWLPPLLRVLVENPSAGAVGGKLLFPDGTLQEAGGVIFSDASGANIGRGDSRPDRPIYSMLREVDYCSGALLATPRALFLELGGFDTRFRPAYYEDTDYCFTLRERGYRVFFQPESEVVHKEGVTSGTDLTAGVKQHQVLNQVRFREKWSEVLPGHLTSKAPDAVAIHEWVFARQAR